MRGWFDSSVHAKLTVITMASCLSALLLAGVSITAYELWNARNVRAEQLTSRADLIGRAITAAVQFNDPTAAGDLLAAFRSDAEVESARIDLADGTHFASFISQTDRIPDVVSEPGVRHVGNATIVSRAIVLDDEQIGTIHVQGSLDRTYAQVYWYLAILLVVLAASCLLAYALSRSLQHLITGPISRLALVAGTVRDGNGYGVRAVRESSDEIGLLVDRFNDMLAQIERRDEALRKARAELENRVNERTKALEHKILERERAESELTLAKAAAEEASIAKSSFLANMSHELRTPLNAIIGYSEMLMEDAEDRGATETIDDLQKITKAGRHLLALITDVLDLSKIEAGRMELHIETINGTTLLEDLVATSEPLAAANGNRLQTSDFDRVGTLETDQTKLRQILMNLVSNACKFTSGGVVRIAAALEFDAGVEWLVVTVADSGIGMTPDQVGRIFHEFVQADSSTTRRYGGTGLGLAISQRICALMGGRIDVQSTLGIGSAFTVRLPTRAVVRSQRAAGSHADIAALAVAGATNTTDATPTGRDLALVVGDDGTDAAALPASGS